MTLVTWNAPPTRQRDDGMTTTECRDCGEFDGPKLQHGHTEGCPSAPPLTLADQCGHRVYNFRCGRARGHMGWCAGAAKRSQEPSP